MLPYPPLGKYSCTWHQLRVLRVTGDSLRRERGAQGAGSRGAGSREAGEQGAQNPLTEPLTGRRESERFTRVTTDKVML